MSIIGHSSPAPEGSRLRRRFSMRALGLLAGLVLAPSVAAAVDGFTTGNVNMRTGPGTGFDKITTLPAGTGVDVIGCTDNGWCQVSAGGPPGWVSRSYLERMSGPPPAYDGPPIVVAPPVVVPPPYYGGFYGPGWYPPLGWGPGYPGYRPPPPGWRPPPGYGPPGYPPRPGYGPPGYGQPGYRPPPPGYGQPGYRPPPPPPGGQPGYRPPPPPPGGQPGYRPPPPGAPLPGYQPPIRQPGFPQQGGKKPMFGCDPILAPCQ